MHAIPKLRQTDDVSVHEMNLQLQHCTDTDAVVLFVSVKFLYEAPPDVVDKKLLCCLPRARPAAAAGCITSLFVSAQVRAAHAQNALLSRMYVVRRD